MRKHDNWAHYERAVQEATDDWVAIGVCLDDPRKDIPEDLVPSMVLAEYALADAVTALQEAQTWHRARSALLFWQTRWATAVEFVTASQKYQHDQLLSGGQYAFSVARELSLANAQLDFCLAELNARVVAFRDIRPEHLGAAARIAYMEHRHG